MPKKGTQIAGKVNFSRAGRGPTNVREVYPKGIKGPKEEHLAPH
jgi:hypothetical protein